MIRHHQSRHNLNQLKLKQHHQHHHNIRHHRLQRNHNILNFYRLDRPALEIQHSQHKFLILFRLRFANHQYLRMQQLN
jgi:hypothetical protein